MRYLLPNHHVANISALSAINALREEGTVSALEVHCDPDDGHGGGDQTFVIGVTSEGVALVAKFRDTAPDEPRRIAAALDAAYIPHSDAAFFAACYATIDAWDKRRAHRFAPFKLVSVNADGSFTTTTD